MYNLVRVIFKSNKVSGDSLNRIVEVINTPELENSSLYLDKHKNGITFFVDKAYMVTFHNKVKSLASDLNISVAGTVESSDGSYLLILVPGLSGNKLRQLDDQRASGLWDS